MAAELAKRLSASGIDVVRTREPGGTPGAEAIRNLILTPSVEVGGWQAMAETLLFYAARRDHLDKLIRPTLERGSWVICDRFSDPTRAYQAAAGGVSSSDVEAIDRICVGDTVPDLTLVLDLPIGTARQRMVARKGSADAIESRLLSYHEAVHHAFLEIAHANPQRCVVLDASAEAERVADAAMDAIRTRLGGVG
ncbi:MAG: dTMP kinase [Hyphomonadaceae bacterium]